MSKIFKYSQKSLRDFIRLTVVDVEVGIEIFNKLKKLNCKEGQTIYDNINYKELINQLRSLIEKKVNYLENDLYIRKYPLVYQLNNNKSLFGLVNLNVFIKLRLLFEDGSHSEIGFLICKDNKSTACIRSYGKSEDVNELHNNFFWGDRWSKLTYDEYYEPIKSIIPEFNFNWD